MASVGAVALLQDCPLESTSLQARELIGKYVSITNDDESETHAINDLANILLEDPFNVDMLQYFSSGNTLPDCSPKTMYSSLDVSMQFLLTLF